MTSLRQMVMSNTKPNGAILQFPTEVFHLIFDYLDSESIIKSIGLVCQQLKEIVNSYNRLKLDFSALSQCQWDSLAPLIKQENVVSISLNGGVKGEYYPVKLFLSLLKFDQLESMRLVKISGEEFDQIFEEIIKRQLKSFSIIFPDQTMDENRREMNLISSMILLCHVQRLDLNLFDMTLISDPALKSIGNVLRSLTINRCTEEQYQFILSSCSYLKLLSIKNFQPKETSFYDDFSLLKPLKTTVPPLACSTYSQLTCLTFQSYSLSLKKFHSLLSLTPSLIHLRVTIRDCGVFDMSCGDSWEEFLQTRLIRLKTFQFLFTCETEEIPYGVDVQSIVESFQTPFWLNEKHWIVFCDYVFDSGRIHLYTASSQFDQNTTVIRSTNLSSDDHLHLIVAHQRNSSDEQVKRRFLQNQLIGLICTYFI